MSCQTILEPLFTNLFSLSLWISSSLVQFCSFPFVSSQNIERKYGLIYSEI